MESQKGNDHEARQTLHTVVELRNLCVSVGWSLAHTSPLNTVFCALSWPNKRGKNVENVTRKFAGINNHCPPFTLVASEINLSVLPLLCKVPKALVKCRSFSYLFKPRTKQTRLQSNWVLLRPSLQAPLPWLHASPLQAVLIQAFLPGRLSSVLWSVRMDLASTV